MADRYVYEYSVSIEPNRANVSKLTLYYKSMPDPWRPYPTPSACLLADTLARWGDLLLEADEELVAVTVHSPRVSCTVRRTRQ